MHRATKAYISLKSLLTTGYANGFYANEYKSTALNLSVVAHQKKSFIWEKIVFSYLLVLYLLNSNLVVPFACSSYHYMKHGLSHNIATTPNEFQFNSTFRRRMMMIVNVYRFLCTNHHTTKGRGNEKPKPKPTCYILYSTSERQ